MRAIVLKHANELVIENVPTPEPGRGEVRIRTAHCAICATDLEMIAGAPRVEHPAILGHEWSGVVDAVGEEVDAGLVGTRCVGDNIIPCGTCGACVAGQPEACSQPREIGFELPGGFGEYFITRAGGLHAVGDDVPLAVAALAEPLAVVLRGLSRLQAPALRRPVVVCGDGPIGLLAVLVMARKGAREITLVGGRAHKLALGEEYGATSTQSYKTEPDRLADALRRAAPEGFGLCVEASGSVTAWELLAGVAGHDADLLMLGDYRGEVGRLDLNAMLHKQLRITASNTATGAWDDAVKFLERRHAAVEQLISFQFDVSRFHLALDTAQNKRDACVKVVVDWVEES